MRSRLKAPRERSWTRRQGLGGGAVTYARRTCRGLKARRELWDNGLRLEVDYGARELDRRLDLLARREKKIVSLPNVLGGEPVFAGTRVSVNHVGRLVRRGVPLEILRKDFLHLKDEGAAEIFELASCASDTAAR